MRERAPYPGRLPAAPAEGVLESHAFGQLTGDAGLEFWRAYAQNRGAVSGPRHRRPLLIVPGGRRGRHCAAPAQRAIPRIHARAAVLACRGAALRFLLGTDPVGCDVLSRLIHGTRLSFVIGLISVALSLSRGVAARPGRGLLPRPLRPSTTVMRLMDVMLALPSLLLAVAVVAVLGPGLANAMYAIAIVMLPHFVRLTRAAGDQTQRPVSSKYTRPYRR